MLLRKINKNAMKFSAEKWGFQHNKPNFSQPGGCYVQWITFFFFVRWIGTILLRWWSAKIESYFMQTGKINIHKYLWRVVGAFFPFLLYLGLFSIILLKDEYFHDNLFHDLKLNNSTWIATCYFCVTVNIERFFYSRESKITLFCRSIHFHIYIQNRQKPKKNKNKKTQTQNSCFIKLLSSQSLTVLIMALSISPFIFQKHITFLFDCSLMLLFKLAKLMNYKWSSQKKLLSPKEYYFISDWDRPINTPFPPLGVSENSLLLLHCI